MKAFKKRYLEDQIKITALNRHKMVFLSGPRQSGKTTLAKQFLDQKDNYYNWDDLDFKKLWSRSPREFGELILNKTLSPTIVLDEFHRNIKWKNQLKGFYDIYGDNIKILVTGSAKLNTYKKGTDSLLGRFCHFHVYPFSYKEILNQPPSDFDLFNKFINSPEKYQKEIFDEKTIDSLLNLSGFPEPFLSQSRQIYQVWSRNRNELLIRQDLKELSQIVQIGHVEILSSFLPERISSPLSYQSLKEDLDVSHTTITRWMNALSMIYFHFEIRPYSKSIPRSLKKEPKIYLYDWASIQNDGPRFENMIACHLLKMIDYYNDTGQANLALFYLRNKEKEEVDFLVTNDGRPFVSIEAKLNETSLDKTHLVFQRKLRIPHFQIIKKSGVFHKFNLLDKSLHSYVMSFDKFFSFGV